MIDRFERFSSAISEISRYWHKIAAEEMARYGLKSAHCIYLLTLYQAPQGITGAQLARQCGKDKADVSRMVNIMQQQGFVRREGTGYRALLYLTETGKSAAAHVQQRAATAVELGGRGICDGDRQTFYRILEQIADNLRTISQEGLPHP